MSDPSPSPTPVPAPEGARRLVERVMSARAEHPDAILVASAPVEAPHPDALLEGVDLPWGASLKSRSGDVWAGVGDAAFLAWEDGAPIAELRRSVQALFRRVVQVTDGPAPRLMGGLAFAPGARTDRRATVSAWGSFGDGGFTLPRWSVSAGPAGAYLTLAADPRARADRLEAELARILEALAAPPLRQTVPTVQTVRHLPPEHWEALVEAAKDAIRGGAFEKLVAARATEVRADAPFDDRTVWSRLCEAHPATDVFLVRRPSGSFVGATPEQLLQLRGGELLTHALAGSRRVDAVASEGSLLDSPKDRWEHEIVARDIAAGLASLCEEVAVDPLPRIKQVRDILHLETPIRARVRPGVHLLDLASALHPTPAVGGTPRLPAVRWIGDHEHAPRGWYAGLVGWVDAKGDGVLSVAIRSGVLSGDLAVLYAGAGIVESSVPSAEYDETALKLRPMLRALGAEA